jgi:hypothetical protein
MRKAICLALLAALASCEQSKTRLDNVARKEAAQAPTPAPSGGPAPGAIKIDRSGTVEQQLARLQDVYDANAEAMAFLNGVYAQQKAQQAAQDQETAAPDAMFAVDISEQVKAGQVDGPAGAAITIVEAWDFA